MSYTTGGTWSVAEVPTASKMNTYIRDNVTYLHDSIPSVSLLGSTQQTITTATWTAVAFALEVCDSDTMHDNVTNNTRITINTAGKYLFIGQVAFEAISNSLVPIGLRLSVNSAAEIRAEKKERAVNEDGTGVGIAFIRDCIATDYVELQAFQNSGGDVDTYISSLGVLFGATRL